MKALTQSTIAVLAFVYASSAIADQGDKPRHRKAPKVAIEACAAMVEGDPCAFEGRDGEAVEGTCFLPPERSLACRPSAPPPQLRWRDERAEDDVDESADAV